MNARARGIIEITIASIGFGFLGIFSKAAFATGLSVGEFLSYRFTLAAAILWIGILIFRPSWVRLSLKQICTAGLLGIFGYAFFSTTYFTAIEGLSITLAALLLYTYPFWVNIFSHFFTHDKVTKKEALYLGVASLGLIFLLWGHVEVKNAWAVLSGLASAISYAGYVMISARVQKDVRPISSALYVITFGAIALSLFHAPSAESISTITTSQALLVLGIALVCTVLPLSLELAALQKLRSKEVALLMMIEPLTATALGILVLRESLGPLQSLGAVLIVTALVANTLKDKKALQESASKSADSLAKQTL
ncbi:transmembrane protein [Bdellovibrio bacteriovorus W]|nr:transmembrane protein [Bdellovibrio bacteriovorus W]